MRLTVSSKRRFRTVMRFEEKIKYAMPKPGGRLSKTKNKKEE